ncbi:MAG TPA: NADH-quinone oxidoreductase subunit NuoF [Candidatus Aminicenantes bacterium]|nr:NADH-quinone oxidoreductase subunit NuoF [Candidatus Aminicenantes bacterium]
MKQIKVGLATCGVSAGGEAVFSALRERLEATKADAKLLETGCVGMCYNEVLVEVIDGDIHHLYSQVTPERVERIVDEDVVGGKAVDEWLVSGPGVDREAAFFSKQKRIVLSNCGIIDPGSIDDYIDRDGYQAVRKAISGMTPEEVIEMIQSSGLRGRGGGGFSTGLKWKFARMAKGDQKYVICNADEGDPGAFMDRSVLEGDPHAVLEGMMVAAYAIGADEGYIYVRAEYPKAIQRLRRAIAQCEERGFLGKGIFGGKTDLNLHIKEGAGAFVCGEETALIASIEGKRGVPRIRPPFPAIKGLWGKPTNINNVETYANVPWIVRNGADAFASMGTERSKGTKVFALAGKIAKSGLVEVPMGITINEIVQDIGGGIRDGKAFKAVQMGGPSGGCIPACMGDLNIDYDEITKTGAIMGSGGMVVLDETTCMVDMAKYFLTFTQNESCGKCTFCRLGTKRMLEILQRITEGRGREGDIELLEDLAEKVRSSSLCGLGQTAPNPVLTTLKYFREEYEAHINEKRCPAGVCKALFHYRIKPDTCVGCTLCARKCPVNAISGEVKKSHVIDQDACIKCGMCYQVCRFDAVEIE